VIFGIRRKTDNMHWRGDRPDDLGGRWVSDINEAKQFPRLELARAVKPEMTRQGNKLLSGVTVGSNHRPASDLEKQYGEEYLHLLDDCEIVILSLTVQGTLDL